MAYINGQEVLFSPILNITNAELIANVEKNLANCRKVVVNKGGTVGEVADFDNLASEIESIPTGDVNYVLVDYTTAYTNVILSGAYPLAKIKSVGGKTHKDRIKGTLEDTTNIRIVSKNAEGEIIDTFTFSEELKNSLSYYAYGRGINNECYNYIDFANKQFVSPLNCVNNMADLVWSWIGNGETRYETFTLQKDIKVRTNPSDITNILCPKYEVQTANDIYRGYEGICTHNQGIWIHDSYYKDSSNLNDFRDKISGNPLYYECEQPIITDISHILKDDIYLKISSGGSVIALNEREESLPFNIAYIRRLT